MSKVKIQGNASGTGVVTLTAPNTNTDRTITLPDGDITLGVGIDDNATSTAITITTDSNTQIGGSDGLPTLQGTGGGKLAIRGRSNSGAIGILQLDKQGDTGNMIDFRSGTSIRGNIALGSNGINVHTGNAGAIYLGGTAAANALDDYETGTWTPTATAWGSITIHSAKYTKIGNQVTLQVYITASSANTASVFIQGLPFTNMSNGWSVGPLNYATSNVNHINPHVRVVSGQAKLGVMKNEDTSMNGTELTGHCIFTVTYFVA